MENLKQRACQFFDSAYSIAMSVIAALMLCGYAFALLAVAIALIWVPCKLVYMMVMYG